MRRRKRLIERDENARVGFPAAMQTVNTRGYADPINAVTSATPLHGVQNPLNTPYRATNSVNQGGMDTAFNAATDTYGAYNANNGGEFNAYNATSGRAYDATNANGAYNTTANANGPINEAYSSALSTAANGAYNEYGHASEFEGEEHY